MTDTKDDSRNPIFEELSKIELELIALKDVVEIIDQIPIEHKTPVYLIKRVAVHTKGLDRRFKNAWRRLIRNQID